MNPAKEEFIQRCRRFAAGVLRFTGRFPRDTTGRHMADQLMRSGTSVGANVQEAQAAQSRADFIHKMHIALKEAREAAYWLTLLKDANYIEGSDLDSLSKEAPQLVAILARSVITAKENLRREKQTYGKED